jgi:hypothetical protein
VQGVDVGAERKERKFYENRKVLGQAAILLEARNIWWLFR